MTTLVNPKSLAANALPGGVQRITSTMPGQLALENAELAKKWQPDTGVSSQYMHDLWEKLVKLDPVLQQFQLGQFVKFHKLCQSITKDTLPKHFSECFEIDPIRVHFRDAESINAVLWPMTMMLKNADPDGKVWFDKQTMDSLVSDQRPMLGPEPEPFETYERYMARCQKQLGVDALAFMTHLTKDFLELVPGFVDWMASGLKTVEKHTGAKYDKSIHGAETQQQLVDILRAWATDDAPPEEAAVVSDEHSEKLANEDPAAETVEFLQHLKSVRTEEQKKASAFVSSVPSVKEVGEADKNGESQKPPLVPKKRGLTGSSVGSPKQPKKPKRTGSPSPSRTQDPVLVEVQKTRKAAGAKINEQRLNRDVLRVLREGKIDSPALATFLGIKESGVTPKSKQPTIIKFKFLRLFGNWLKEIGFRTLLSLGQQTELLIRAGPMLFAHIDRVSGGINGFCMYFVDNASKTSRAHLVAAVFPHIVDQVAAAKKLGAVAKKELADMPAKEIKSEP